MDIIKRATLQDLLEDNACIGPDGGIWYPSGPYTEHSFESLLVELVAPRGKLNKKALSALAKAANVNLGE